MSDLLEIANLSYKRNQKNILKNINLRIKSGHFIALAGENGAGKTTLMRLISGVAHSNQGTILINSNHKSFEKKKHVSFTDSLVGFSENVKLIDIKNFYFKLYPDFSLAKFSEISEFLDIDKNNKLSQLSKGMKERLIIALTLSRETDLYLLDEPFSGIDIMSREKIINSLLTWIEPKATVIISSHKLAEIANLIDEIVIIKDKGVYEHSSVEDIRNLKKMSIEDYFVSIYQEDSNDKI